MWTKTLKSPLAYLVYGLVIGILLYKSFATTDDRFVKSFQRNEPQMPSNIPDTPKTKQAMLLIAQIEPLVKNFSWFNSLDEFILVRVTDADNALFSIRIKNGAVTIKPGWVREEKPTLILENIKVAHLKRLQQVLADKNLDESEMFEIASVFMVPGLQALYNSDVLYFPGDKRFLKLDNLIQVELLNKYGVKDLEGNPLVAKATVMNVDGYWMVFDGWQGNPDVRYSVDVNQIIKYYYIINYKFKGLKPSDLMARKEILDEYMKLRDETLTYTSH